MSAGLVQHWLQTGRLHLPFPAAGHTEQRWRQLAELAAEDIVAARIAESHVDAAAILHELGAKPPEPEQLWAVWTAESSGATLAATGTGDDFVLHGTKQWCAGAGFCTHALVTAQLGIGPRVLMAVAVTGTGVRALPSRWWNPGMAGADIRAVQFTGAPAVLIGGPGDYWNRPGLWHGAAGQAACWLGGARGGRAFVSVRGDRVVRPVRVGPSWGGRRRINRRRCGPRSGGRTDRQRPARPVQHRTTHRSSMPGGRRTRCRKSNFAHNPRPGIRPAMRGRAACPPCS